MAQASVPAWTTAAATRLVLGLLVAPLLGAKAAPLTREFALGSLRLAACELRNGQVACGEWFDPGSGSDLCFEAEDGTGLIAEPTAGLVDPECSGQRCLVKVDRALFPFRVTRPGRYVRWSRAFFPQGGGWCHSESLDFGPAQWTTDCDGSTAGRWVWVSGPVYDLATGVHLLWLHNWHGGAKLDRVALLPVGEPAPDGLGPAAIRRTPAGAGWALTPAFAVPGLRAVTAVTWPFAAGGGSVRVAVSTDGGATFAPLPPPGVGVPVSPDGRVPQIVLRAEVERGAGDGGPRFDAPCLSCETDAGAFMVLENESVRATFLRTTAVLVGLEDKRTHATCLVPTADGLPFELRHLPAEATNPEPIPPAAWAEPSAKAVGSRLLATYATADGLRVRLMVGLRGAELEWQLRLDNRSSLEVVEVVVPVLPGIRLGERSADDALMTPNWQGGAETSDPVQSGGGEVRYPAGGAMAWLDLSESTPRHGLYLSSHDPALLGTVLRAEPRPESDTLTFSVTRFARVPQGRTWDSPPVVLGLHPGDWHAAADAYRAWAHTWMQPPSPPEWVREADAWYGLVVSADSNRVPFERLPESLTPMRELGTNYIQVWGQMTGGSNCDALPYPNPVLGSAEAFTAAIAEIRRWGGHITFYVSSQFWRVDYGDSDLLGSTPRRLIPPACPIWDWHEWRSYAIRTYAQECCGDTPLTAAEKALYGTPWRRTVPCPFTDAWARRHLYHWCVDEYGHRYRASGIYLDETAAAGERYCFAPDHGHADHGIWGASLARSMATMVRAGRSRDPDWMFAFEGCSDVIGQFADVNLISPASAKKPGLWGATRRFAPEVFHYTFPEYILYDGVANGVYGGIPVEDVLLSVHLHGNRFDAFSAQPAAEYVALRQRTKQLLYRARFLDDLGVRTAAPDVHAKVSRLLDATQDVWILNLANPAASPGVEVDLALPTTVGMRWSAYGFDLDGGEGRVELKSTSGGIAFAAPACRASTVVIADRCEPLVRVPVVRAMAGDAAELRIAVTNASAHGLTGRVTVEGELLGQRLDARDVELPAQVSASTGMAFVVPLPSRRGAVAGHVRFDGSGFTVRRPFEVLVEDPVEVAAAMGQASVRFGFRNRSQSELSGTVRFGASPVLTHQPGLQSLHLGPAALQELHVPLAPDLELSEPATVEVTLDFGGVPESRRVWLRPLLCNGGFERVSGDRPTLWEYQNGRLASACRTEPAQGQVALELKGEAGAFVEAHQTLPVVVGMTYRAGCQMRRTAGAGGTVGPAVVLFPDQGQEQYIHLQKQTAGADDQWNTYAATFTVPARTRSVAFYLYNVNSTATVWFDAASLTTADPAPVDGSP